MATKAKKITVNEFKKCVRETSDEPTVTIDWHGLQVEVRRRLSLDEMLEFVRGVEQMCFMDDGTTYAPELQDFAIWCSFVTMYTNITLPSDVKSMYELMLHSDIENAIMGVVDARQFDAMSMAINERVQQRLRMQAASAAKQLDELYTTMNALAEKLSDVFENVDGDTVSKLASTLANGGFDEAKLVKAFANSKGALQDGI